jgi:hypothetical protein
MSNIDERMFDKRVVERNIKRGKITREQYEAWLNNLEDCEELSQPTRTVFVTRLPDGSES